MSDSICTECRALLNAPGEYHPYAFCVLKKAGLDPWLEVRVIAAQIGFGDAGERPPQVSRLVAAPTREAPDGE